jgi:ABC-2 type transport system permease protein
MAMAVYEHRYRPYTGRVTPSWSRFLIIPRHAYRDVFRSKLFTAFFAICFVYPLIAAILVYLHHNANAIALLKLNIKELVPINASFFQTFVVTQGAFGFFLALLVGPPLISRDLANNALPLYLCRPFTRAEYVLGKMSVVVILLSAITWAPGLLLFLFQSYLEGARWFAANLWIAGAILLGSWVLILLLALLSQAISAWVKWRVVASAALLGIYFIPTAFAEVIEKLFYTRLGNLFSLPAVMRMIWSGLFGTFIREVGDVNIVGDGRGGMQAVNITLQEPPLWAAWVSVSIICALCLLLLFRKVRAYEVIK